MQYSYHVRVCLTTVHQTSFSKPRSKRLYYASGELTTSTLPSLFLHLQIHMSTTFNCLQGNHCTQVVFTTWFQWFVPCPIVYKFWKVSCIAFSSNVSKIIYHSMQNTLSVGRVLVWFAKVVVSNPTTLYKLDFVKVILLFVRPMLSPQF
jgi:hypothetical protein